MTGSDLVVEIPWIVFGLSLAAICLHLRRSRRFPRRPRSRKAQPPPAQPPPAQPPPAQPPSAEP